MKVENLKDLDVFVKIWMVCSTLMLFRIFWIQTSWTEAENSEISSKYFKPRKKFIQILETGPEPMGSKNIFFFETTGPKERNLVLRPREVCAVEAASKSQPDWEIYLFVMNVDFVEVDPLWNVLSSLPNVNIKPIDFRSYTKGTPGEKIVDLMESVRGGWLPAHRADLLRFITLDKYAGVHNDLDSILIKSLNDIEQNFFVMPNGSTPASGIFGFSQDKGGREMAKIVLDDFVGYYNTKVWAQSLRPLKIGLQRVCGTYDYMKATQKQCKGFKLYEYKHFLPLLYFEWEDFFKRSSFSKVMKATKDAHAVHLYGGSSLWTKTGTKNRTVPINEIAFRYCPKVYAAVREV